MRLICLNVALFVSNNEKVITFLKNQKPDIICLQEVAKSVDKSVYEKYISLDSINSATKQLMHSFYGPTSKMKDFKQKNFHKEENFYIDLGGFLEIGNYIKSKYKIINTSNIFIKNKYKEITDWENWPGNEAKAVLVVDLELKNGEKIRIINYHGIWTKEKIGNKETLNACRKINDLAKEVNYPVIIVGDFNLFPDTQSMRVFKDFQSLVDVYNIKTTRPSSNELSSLKRNIVDYIFVSSGIKVTSFKVLDSDVSDHLPLILDFEI